MKNRELFLRHDKNGDGHLDEQEQDALWTEWRLKPGEKKAALAKPVSQAPSP